MSGPQNRPEPMTSAEVRSAQFRVAVEPRPLNLRSDGVRVVYSGSGLKRVERKPE
jgi:hypothetical protein